MIYYKAEEDCWYTRLHGTLLEMVKGADPLVIISSGEYQNAVLSDMEEGEAPKWVVEMVSEAEQGNYRVEVAP